MTNAERGLLLTVARLLRAHLHDSLPLIPNRQDHGHVVDDIADLNEALRLFDPSPAEPVNEQSGAD